VVTPLEPLAHHQCLEQHRAHRVDRQVCRVFYRQQVGGELRVVKVELLLVPKLRLGVCRAKPEMRGLAPRKRQEETHRSIPVGEPKRQVPPGQSPLAGRKRIPREQPGRPGHEAGRSDTIGRVMEPRNELKLRVPTLSQERKAASRRSERRCFGGTRRGLRAGHVVKGDIQELGRPEGLLTEREPDGGTGIERPPVRGEGIARRERTAMWRSGIEARGGKPKRPRRGSGVVAAHSTGEGGEPRSKGAAGGKGHAGSNGSLN
jgi:hypothetical protein